MAYPLEDSENEEPDPADKVEVEADEEELESSLEELLAKKVDAAPGEDEESLLDMAPDERVETLSIRAAPRQPNEFVCSNCRLVKHDSQLADRKRRLCRDCV